MDTTKEQLELVELDDDIIEFESTGTDSVNVSNVSNVTNVTNVTNITNV